MADFEDATAPSIPNIVAAHANMLDYRDGTLAHDHPATGRAYRVTETPGLLIVRPRGLHVHAANVPIGGHPVSAALFDVGLTLFHLTAKAMDELARGCFGEDRMLAYGATVQREEIRRGIPAVRHQHEVGSDLGDTFKEMVAGDRVLKAGGAANTMNQFAAE